MNKALFILKDMKTLTMVRICDIVYLKSCSGYTKVYMNEGKPITQSGSIKQHFEKLAQTGLFVKINRSCAVNIRYIKHIVKGSSVLLLCDTQLSLSSSYEKALFKLFNIL
jgi:DNA-binding LytR/AlgR family response regulator